MLIILKKGHKLKDLDQFDAFISAELPDKKNPYLHSMVVKACIKVFFSFIFA